MAYITRRNFLKLGAAGLGAVLLHNTKLASAYLPDFPGAERLGRCFASTNVHARPDRDSAVVNSFFSDGILNIYRDVIGKNDSRGYRSRTWYETDGGYVYAPDVQPVKNSPNTPLTELPNYGVQPGFWAEVTVPFVDLTLINERPLSPLLTEMIERKIPPRFYFSQVFWVNGISSGNNGEPVYRVGELYGTYGDIFWADARAFMPLKPEDLTPISPEVQNKEIVVNVVDQTISCLEDNREIFYGVVSTGAVNTFTGIVTDAWSTPLGDYFAVNRKYVSLHMAGGDGSKASGYEEFAVSYTSIFATGGISFHSTYWHNAWGNGMSHGCVNLKPDDAKFIYRWTQPDVPYYEGMVDQQSFAGTKVRVVDE